MLFYLVLSVMVLFACYHLYSDVKNKINTGNTFAEGMANAGIFNPEDQRYCAKYDSYNRHNVEVSAASPQSSLKANCEKKANELGHDAYATGKGNARSGPYNCTTYKNCTLSAPGTSASWTRNGAYKYYKKTTPKSNTTCEDKIKGCDVHKANGGCLDANPQHDSWRKNCVKTCGYCDDPKYNPAVSTGAGERFYFASERKTFMEHYQAALAMGGNLASIHSAEENKKVLDVIPNGTGGRIYIGAIRKRPHNGSRAANAASGKDPRYWGWTDGSEWNYSNWRNGEPNNCCHPHTGNIGEIHGEIQKHDGKWNDIAHRYYSTIIKAPAVYKLNVTYPNTTLIEKQTDGGQTWQQQKELCESNNGKLASRKEILNFMKGKPASYDKWVPTSDSNNSWLQVGNRKSRAKLTPDYGLLHQDIPDVAYQNKETKWIYADGKPKWGTQKNKLPWRKSVYCNIPKKEETNDNKVGTDTCLQAPPPKVDADKCITPDQLSWGSKIMSMLNGVAGKSKCVDSAAVKKVTETAGPDLILALGAANKHLRQAQPHLQAALKDAEPHLNNAISKSQTHMGSIFVNPVTQSQQASNVSGNEVQKVEDNNLPTQNTEASEPQKENTVLGTAELPTQGTNSDELNSKIIENNNARPEQQRQKFTDKHFTMPNGNIVLPSKGNCPNGCKAPTYDSESCANQIFMDKEYRNCPWVDEKGNSGSCQGCGAVLLPKNKYGYARTRPGFFSDKTVKNILDQNDFSPKDKKDSVDMGNNLTVGKDFMSELASQKKFNIPRISNAEYQQLGKLVQKYQLAGGDSITNKFNLTNAVNSLLNTNPLASNLLENKDDSNNLNGEKTENIPSNQPVDKIVGNSYKKRSINKDDSAQYNTAYTTTYKPVDPNSHPNPYNSLWGSL